MFWQRPARDDTNVAQGGSPGTTYPIKHLSPVRGDTLGSIQGRHVRSYLVRKVPPGTTRRVPYTSFLRVGPVLSLVPQRGISESMSFRGSYIVRKVPSGTAQHSPGRKPGTT